ncbi:ZIP zinc transporter [Solemya velum gill symbiont]|uniref:ZIP zinc transporter n=1 Tax=Solemya velum gill symbiont TaxID=2340 RepID=A0A1T2CSL6_SOVGS|nr:ZIP family metal transporter [Solemya velum gill symbiont]OOY35187.1 ZIP zinc transporter [Solemya velum gill symbiont]OOY37797.1 ZIP zinc transporter [Solemya velum gill symbiont]OOY41092.1 ZIP zinc transporter [Solemya velum gill symbiont]OOY43141.1 ZIP zinc transporter [Solemya velum gill symbiont]OOY52735.1 ZIP zinc transporter [Solemya velum gill symbiont]
MLLAWIIAFSVLGSIGAIVGAALLLLFKEPTRKVLLPCLLSYAIGTLLGAAFLGMIPNALAQETALAISGTVLAGIVIFFFLEKIIIWRHCHNAECEVHGTAGPLILIGDAFHNFVDGFVMAAAFLTSVPLGIAASLAVIAHEIPQEVGDFAILLDNGYSKRRALALNLLSSLTTLPGAVIAYFFLGATREVVPFILALSAASFIYIAIADLVPSLHRKAGLKPAICQLCLILAGIGTIAVFRLVH